VAVETIGNWYWIVDEIPGNPLADGRGNEIQEIPGSHQAEVLHGVALVDFGGGPVEIAHPIPSQPFLFISKYMCGGKQIPPPFRPW
jgi:hypothetical protein